MTKDSFFALCRRAYRRGPTGALLDIVVHVLSVRLVIVVGQQPDQWYHDVYEGRYGSDAGAVRVQAACVKFRRWLYEFNSNYMQVSTAGPDFHGPYEIRPLVWVMSAIESLDNTLAWIAAGAMGAEVYVRQRSGGGWYWDILAADRVIDSGPTCNTQRLAMAAAEAGYRDHLRREALISSAYANQIVEVPRHRELDIPKIGS